MSVRARVGERGGRHGREAAPRPHWNPATTIKRPNAKRKRKQTNERTNERTNAHSGRFKWDLLTTVPWEGVVIATARIDCASRAADYVMLLGLLKLGRMYRLFVMFRFFTYNLALSLVAITLLRNLAYVIYLLHW